MTTSVFESMKGFLIYNGPVLPVRPKSSTQFDLMLTYSGANLFRAYLALLRRCAFVKLVRPKFAHQSVLMEGSAFDKTEIRL